MAAIAGLRGTGDWSTDERPKNFREMILWRNPNGTAPLFALMSKVQKESTDDPEFAWWDEPNDIVRLQVNGALSAVAPTVIVDSSDPTSGSPGNNWGTATNLKAGDLLLVEPAADAATYTNEIIEVVSVQSSTEFVAKRGAAGTTAATIANDLYLSKIGSNYSEGTGAPESASRNPVKYSNYTQIFKDTYEVTGTASQTYLRTGDPLKNDKKRKAFDHARDIEMAFLFGQSSEITGDNGKPKRTTKGLRAFMGYSTMMVTSWTINGLLDAIAPVFDFDTDAGDSRVVFCGNQGLNYFNKAVMAVGGAAKIDFVGTSKQWGMSFSEYRIPQGTLYIKTHPLLNRNSLYRNSMWVIDFSALRYRPMKGRDTQFKDNVQDKDEDLIRGFWQTEAGLEVRYGGLTCAYIGGLNLANT